jgi:hypothetical protein
MFLGYAPRCAEKAPLFRAANKTNEAPPPSCAAKPPRGWNAGILPACVRSNNKRVWLDDREFPRRQDAGVPILTPSGEAGSFVRRP